jgi:hypothetical protein
VGLEALAAVEVLEGDAVAGNLAFHAAVADFARPIAALG